MNTSTYAGIGRKFRNMQEVQESAGIAGIARNCMFIYIARFS
jgi:hypothetical protein